jgi:hypothetical protein
LQAFLTTQLIAFLELDALVVEAAGVYTKYIMVVLIPIRIRCGTAVRW